VRYHPSDAENGDMTAWVQYVHEATAALAQNPALTALTITNEVNFPTSPNTSDGAYKNALEARVLGIEAAHTELTALGRGDVSLGFSYAYRYLPSSDEQFWKGIAQRATPAFRQALDYVGVQLYPGLVYPPVLPPGQTPATRRSKRLPWFATAICRSADWAITSSCGSRKTATPPTSDTPRHSRRRTSRARWTIVYRYSSTFGVTDYRYFNLRDNVPDGTDLFDDVGLLRSDYTQKPAFSTYRNAIATYGTAG